MPKYQKLKVPLHLHFAIYCTLTAMTPQILLQAGLSYQVVMSV